MKHIIPHSWQNILSDYTKTASFKKCIEFVKKEYTLRSIFPAQKDLFNALEYASFDDVSVVILGQDPYHQPGQAHGLSFSVPENTALPPSLKNIYKEIESDVGIKKDFKNGNLIPWAHQGVLLLNSVLTVIEDNPASHANQGWEEFTDTIIEKISQEKESVVFLLWGNYAQRKGSFIDRSKHLVLETSHPSPLGSYRGFVGCKHFSKTNEYLKSKGKNEIHW